MPADPSSVLLDMAASTGGAASVDAAASARPTGAGDAYDRITESADLRPRRKRCSPCTRTARVVPLTGNLAMRRGWPRARECLHACPQTPTYRRVRAAVASPAFVFEDHDDDAPLIAFSIDNDGWVRHTLACVRASDMRFDWLVPALERSASG